MKILEKVLAALILLSIIMKLSHLQGASVLFVVSVGSLSNVYYFLSIGLFNDISFKKMFKKKSYEGISTLRIIGSVAAGFAFSIAIIGILFKIQHYPGANMMLILGFASSLIVIVISVIKYVSKGSKFYIGIIKRAIILCAFGIFLYLYARQTVDRVQYRDFPDYIKASEYYHDHPDSDEAYENMTIEYYKMVYSEMDSSLYEPIEKQVKRDMEIRKSNR